MITHKRVDWATEADIKTDGRALSLFIDWLTRYKYTNTNTHADTNAHLHSDCALTLCLLLHHRMLNLTTTTALVALLPQSPAK